MLTLLLLSLTIIGCKKAPPQDLPSESVSLEDPAPQLQSAAHSFSDGHMSAHYSITTAARDALIRNDIESAQQLMEWISGHASYDDLPPELDPYLIEMKATAGDLAEASELAAAAQGLAAVANTCGNCHLAGNTLPVFNQTPIPEDRVGIEWHMARHFWAINQMWEGLIVPSDTQWRLGVEALQEIPVASGELHEDQQLTPETEMIASWVSSLADMGPHMGNDASRVRLYGELLTSCAACHAEMLQ